MKGRIRAEDDFAAVAYPVPVEIHRNGVAIPHEVVLAGIGVAYSVMVEVEPDIVLAADVIELAVAVSILAPP